MMNIGDSRYASADGTGAACPGPFLRFIALPTREVPRTKVPRGLGNCKTLIRAYRSAGPYLRSAGPYLRLAPSGENWKAWFTHCLTEIPCLVAGVKTHRRNPSRTDSLNIG